MPEGYDQLTKTFFHTERNVGLGLDMDSAPREVPEGAGQDARAVLFSGGKIEPAKTAAGVDLFGTTRPWEDILHTVAYGTRTTRFLMLLGVQGIWAVSSQQCALIPGETLDDGVNQIPWYFSPETSRWEACILMHEGVPVVVVNNSGLDSPAYWDAVAPCFKMCTPTHMISEF